ncbi:30S ribosome-binding factor RbfA [Xanthovirga aplysinae]|uniref:30S ribosome-binding factor RbfA n=1 Tax=Xanthovirga aplysinae TaxID=2529853 RepID=UPI0012BCA522|nr:30S ribosome-binding factor RbfA [Xanthovirga aplysinae]MTI32207.1 30S ribosome-binding factor RbfA [Xanthovirga aplysinae]
METKRQQKFSRLILREMGDIFQKDTRHLFGSTFITVSEVKISPDLSVARVWLSFMLAGNTKEMLEKVNAHKKEIRKQLGLRIGKQVRIVPELVFKIDEGGKNAQRIEEILSNLDIPEEGQEKGMDAYNLEDDVED